MTSSNTSSWFLDNAGIITEAYARCGIRPTAITREHLFQATRSLNLELQSYSNRGVNLWQVDLQSIPLVAGQATYDLPSNTVNILDAYVETYSLLSTISGTPDCSTVAGSDVVTINAAENGLLENNWTNVVVPISVGGVLLQGMYQVQTALNANQFTIQAAAEATTTVNNGGALPVYTTVAGSQSVGVALAANSLLPGNTYTVNEATSVGGLLLTGEYVVATAATDSFTFLFGDTALTNDTETENLGSQVISTSANSGAPNDRIMTSISRTDYAAQSNKAQQGAPSTFWFDRLSPIPSVTLWLVPDSNGPYAFFYYRMRRIQDAAATSGQTPDVPYRFLDTVCAGLAVRLARKFAPALVQSLMEDAKISWAEASEEDRERVEMFLIPDTSGYFRG